MSDDLRTRITAVVEDHDVEQEGVNYWQCTCGEKFYLSQDEYCSWQEHLADAVIRELEADYILVPKGHTIARIRSAEKLGLTGDGA